MKLSAMKSSNSCSSFLPVSSHYGILDIVKSFDVSVWRPMMGNSRKNLEEYGHLPVFQLRVGGRDEDCDPHLLCSGAGGVVTTISAKASQSSKRLEKLTRWRLVPVEDVNGRIVQRIDSNDSMTESSNGCRVALMDGFGMFLGHKMEGFACLTTSSTIGGPQMFEMVQHHDNSVSFLGSTGRFLTSRSGPGYCIGSPRSMISHPVGLLKDNHFHVNITRWTLTQVHDDLPHRYEYKPAVHLPACQKAM